MPVRASREMDASASEDVDLIGSGFRQMAWTSGFLRIAPPQSLAADNSAHDVARQRAKRVWVRY